MSGERSVVLGLVQMSMTDEPAENLSKAVEMIEEASRKGAGVVCLPELFASRYFPQERKAKVKAEPVPGPTTRRLSSVAKKNKVAIVGGSICEKAGGRLYNTSVVLGPDGEMLGKYRKVHIPQDESFYEQSYFTSGADYRAFQTPRAKVGVLICFDQWYPEAAREERLLGAEVLFYPTAIGRPHGRRCSGVTR
jgi:N-carbamoylputrescine amidase